MPTSSSTSPSPVMDPVEIALKEDLGAVGDLTCRYFVAASRYGTARIFAKEPAVVAGAEVAAKVFQRVNHNLEVTITAPDGTTVKPGQEVLRIQGAVRAILSGERVALNFLQQLSGVATATRRFVDAVAGTSAKILDTRKTTPGLRALEKAAVRAGGGVNHRFGLYDMVMVKDNHIAADSRVEHLRDSIASLHSEQPNIRVELEADTVDQVRDFLTLEGVAVILLDNMSLQDLRTCVEMGKGRVLFEASGGVNLQTVRGIAETGVDYISVGALTHSAPAIDFSLELLE